MTIGCEELLRMTVFRITELLPQITNWLPVNMSDAWGRSPGPQERLSHRKVEDRHVPEKVSLRKFVLFQEYDLGFSRVHGYDY